MQCLAPTLQGGLAAMVYAEGGRLGVYQTQAMARLLSGGLGDSMHSSDMRGLTRKLLNALPATHHLRASRLHEADIAMGSDVGLVDLILHAQDRAYTVPQFEDLARSAGMRLISFALPSRYNVLPHIHDEQLRGTVSRLSWLQRAAFAESFLGNMTKHTAFMVKAANPVQLPVPGDVSVVPHLRTFCPAKLAAEAVEQGAVQLSPHPPLASSIVALMDGRHSRQEILATLLKENPHLESRQIETQVDTVFWVMRECSAFNYEKVPGDKPLPFNEQQPNCKFDTFWNS